ncbi:hypothetical protein [Cryobacterium sp. GrIS_2_6]|uniref:hypothetical protein n=1 Tax=Cryobacterium sp. GrIS_2_6 TaxID=3162785 RepID=UPI002E01427E|nr:hypothetical protein [Cryobacterium psychrotolerans]
MLLALDPSPVVRLNRAAALAESGDPAAALAVVDRIGGLDDYFWFHATRPSCSAGWGVTRRPALLPLWHASSPDLRPSSGCWTVGIRCTRQRTEWVLTPAAGTPLRERMHRGTMKG